MRKKESARAFPERMKMKTQSVVWLALFVFAATLSSAQAALAPEESNEFNRQPAPSFSVRDVKGNPFSLEKCDAPVLLLNFFASWCPPCRTEIGELSRLHKQYAGRGLAVVGLAVDPVMTPDTVGDVGPLVEKLGIPYPVALATPQIAKAYHFKGIPTTMVIGKDRKIIRTFYGYHDGRIFEALVKSLLPPPAPKPK